VCFVFLGFFFFFFERNVMELERLSFFLMG